MLLNLLKISKDSNMNHLAQLEKYFSRLYKLFKASIETFLRFWPFFSLQAFLYKKVVNKKVVLDWPRS